MRSLPLIVPDGCSLTQDSLADQAGRAARLRPSVADVERSAETLRVSFAAGVDRALVDEVVATEQQCCSFLAVEYDGVARVLSVAADDARGREVVRQLAEFFEEGR